MVAQHVPAATRAPSGRSRPVFLFDGDCGVCQDGTDAIRRRIDPPADIVAYQSVDLGDHGVTAADVLEGPVLVRADGTHVIGPLAMAELLRSSRRPYRYLGAAMVAPGMRQILHAAGPFLYRQRSRLPGSTGACLVAADGGAVRSGAAR
jgi:predicted DCC family thiol-disulfide oxidoreductase YuxK